MSKSIRQYAWIHDLGPIKRALFRRERFAEQAKALPKAPGHVMVAADRLMMGAAAAR